MSVSGPSCLLKSDPNCPNYILGSLVFFLNGGIDAHFFFLEFTHVELLLKHRKVRYDGVF